MESLTRFGTFLKESWHEVSKQVTYPSWEEVKGTSTVVIVTSGIFAVYLSACDLVMAGIVQWFFSRLA